MESLLGARAAKLHILQSIGDHYDLRADGMKTHVQGAPTGPSLHR